VQQLGSGVSAFLAGAIVVKNEATGLYENFNYVGYIAIAINILSIFVILRIKTEK
jgi:hypothetical protein